MGRPIMWWSTGLQDGSGSRSSRGRRRSGGFTLLEVIIAFTILAVAMTALLQAFSSGLRGLGSASASTAAVLHARSKIDEMGAAIPLDPGEQDGTFEDGYQWVAVIREHQAVPAAELDYAGMVPYEVEVTVSAPDGASVRLTTLRLAPAP